MLPALCEHSVVGFETMLLVFNHFFSLFWPNVSIKGYSMPEMPFEDLFLYSVFITKPMRTRRLCLLFFCFWAGSLSLVAQENQGSESDSHQEERGLPFIEHYSP